MVGPRYVASSLLDHVIIACVLCHRNFYEIFLLRYKTDIISELN